MENKYVEMIIHLAEQPRTESLLPAGLVVRPLHAASDDDLYDCYYQAFAAGDAQFFFDQNEQGRREFFDTLGIGQARKEPASLLLLKDDRIVAFTTILPYGEANCHISCMCVLPDFRRQGLGKFMLHFVVEKVAESGNKTITLGTDTNMAAFQLYRKHGFKAVEETQT